MSEVDFSINRPFAENPSFPDFRVFQQYQIATDIRGVAYWHFMFDRHEIVCADGALAEALYPGPEALKSVSDGAREELLALFPNADWNTSSEMPEPARPFVRAKRARQLLERSQKNKKPLVATKEQSVPA